MEFFQYKGAYIKHVGEGGGGGDRGFYKFFKKNRPLIFHGPVIFSENISGSLPSILVSYLRLTGTSVSG